MSENVRAVLDAAGHTSIPVYRVDEREIGCSLAIAESRMYQAWLQQCSEIENALHVVYINTSLRSKAIASILPTITCTSSNVLQTILQIGAEKPETQICYGLDTYMGRNLRVMLTQITDTSDSTIQAMHQHNRESIQQNFVAVSILQAGQLCCAHHMFGGRSGKGRH